MNPRDPINVLAVDDNVDFVELLKEFLEREDEGLAIVIATDANEGLQLLREQEFDCVVSDYDMPGMTGLEFFHEVRQRWEELPFILFTGQGDKEIERKIKLNDATGYLQKKVGTDQFSALTELVREKVS